ncbi:MAG: magnesium transporter [Lachnospiraceae bacterium]|nr:magnesium transporter [Lachnospiraceae bacterium]
MEEREEYNDVIEEELLDVMRSGLTQEELCEKLDDYHDNDIAQILPELTPEERQILYRSLGLERVSDVFSYLDDVEDYFKELGVEKSADILEEMDADDAIDVLESLPEEQRDELLSRMDEESQEDIALITSYDDDEIGSLMTTNFVVIKKGMTVKQAMSELIRQSAENDNISTLYVVDQDDRFYGAIDLKDLICARADTDPETFTQTSYPYVNHKALISDEIERLRAYSEDSIPVLDDEDHILGVITAFHVVEAVDNELGEDYAKLAGLTAEEDLNEKLPQSIRKRLPWLVVLLAFGLVVSTVVGVFEGVVRQIALVVCFQSLILDMAGNTGTQSLAVTIRVLMDEALTGADKAKFLFKEFRVGLSNGAIMGCCSCLLVGLYIHFLKGYPLGYSFTISACVGLSLWIAMIVASLVGTVVPMLFHKLNVDPAVASGPLITTTNDLIAVVTYYGMAWVLLINVLHLGNL